MKKFDDTELLKKKKGDKIFYRREDFYRNEPPIERTLYVTSISKEYIYARGSNDKDSLEYRERYKFYIDNGQELSDYARTGYCYSSKGFYDKTVEFDTKRSTITDCVERMHTESDMRLVDAMYELMNNWECCMYSNCRKANAKEIVEHFKTK